MARREDVTGRILVVEDDGVARTVLARDLREIGHVVAEASTSAEGLEWARTWPPDVVLLDRHLPDGDGMALLAQLKGDSATRDVPVVIVTSTTDPDFVVEALHSGAHDYLSKPFRHEEVLARTQAALRTKALVDELRRLTDHDPLTGLRNRRGVSDQLTTWRAHCSRHGLPLAVVMLDVIGFRQLNEQHSHAAGDRVLRAVAEQLQGCVRAEDVVGRWSGDEFLVLLPQAESSTALALVERVNTRLAGQNLLDDRRVTLRAGVAVAAPGDTEDDEHLLGRAAVSLLKQRGPLRQLA
ncbi:MAG: diguanylate cyclase [Streptomyces sp.]|uniref:GGDEF domain-containing response regulator n=1 Tax=Streptomyces sp. TaxID=1931 RepID=UPI0025FC8D76|nr:diguanylate cyclase [Streptomyces sp.]MBW8792222.1 diguanylate cyclase [Streptomyces sp.]